MENCRRIGEWSNFLMFLLEQRIIDGGMLLVQYFPYVLLIYQHFDLIFFFFLFLISSWWGPKTGLGQWRWCFLSQPCFMSTSSWWHSASSIQFSSSCLQALDVRDIIFICWPILRISLINQYNLRRSSVLFQRFQNACCYLSFM